MTIPSVSPNETSEFLIYFAQIHETFRKAELDSLAKLGGIEIGWKDYSDSCPFAIITLESPSQAEKLIQRSILTKGIYSLWGSGITYDELHASVRSRTSHLGPSCMNKSFKFDVECFNGKQTAESQVSIIESFSYLGLNGRIKLKNPEISFCVFEEYSSQGSAAPKRVFLGKLVATGSRGLVEKYDLKKRHYIGTTSMDAELSLVTANMALSAPGKVVYDPFVGTGSFIVSCSHFGALTMGSDIDGRQIRGKKGRSVMSNFKQYGITSNYLDSFVSDLTNTPLRKTRFLDAIVCDPPYGVREGLKVLGSRDPEKGKELVIRNGELRHLQSDYVPPKKPYSFLAMLDDILQFSVDHLVPGGRLCFWMPTANEDFSQFDIPMHPQMELAAVSVQEFNKWSRRLLTYSRKHGDEGAGEAAKMRAEILDASKKWTADELNGFRKKYFEGFKPAPT
ncbi:hypothetical protein RUND412_000657 [Rhizina undulata]